MNNMVPDLLRAISTDVMLVLLLWTMATPKYKNKFVYIFSTVAILIVNISFNYYFYLKEDYTSVFYVDLTMLILIGIVLKPLFVDRVMQWGFSYITVLNIYIAIVFLSYSFSDIFPDPMYGMIYLRIILFSAVIVVFRKWVSDIYRNVLDYWHIYMLPIAALLLCFLGYLFGGNIEERLTYNYVPLMFLMILGLSVYIAIIHSLKTIKNEYRIREENQNMKSEREYLCLAAESMSKRLELMEEVSAQNIRASHDRRHFNNMILELLEQDKKDEAIEVLLANKGRVDPKQSRIYCENHVLNAAVSHYAAIAEQNGIIIKIQLEIPSELPVDSLEFAMAVSNLMENAIQSCEKLKNQGYIKFICQNVGRILLEIENSCIEGVVIDRDGLPVTVEKGHGIGSKSVLAFVKKYEGELNYKIENGIFRVRILV